MAGRPLVGAARPRAQAPRDVRVVMQAVATDKGVKKAVRPLSLEEGDLPMNTFKNKQPFVGEVMSVERIVGPKATGETCHIKIRTKGKIPFWEGQSYGVIPPVREPPSDREVFVVVSKALWAHHVEGANGKMPVSQHVGMCEIRKLVACSRSTHRHLCHWFFQQPGFIVIVLKEWKGHGWNPSLWGLNAVLPTFPYCFYVPQGTKVNSKGKEVPLGTRLYSIASTRYGDSFDGMTTSFCVRRATYTDPETGKEDPSKKGICSNFLCDAKKGTKINMTGMSACQPNVIFNAAQACTHHRC